MFRWFAVAILLSAIGTSGYYRRRARLRSETIARRREGGFFLALRAFVATKQAHELLMAGPYRWVRHPLSTTGITLFVALGLTLASWFVLVMATAAALLIRVLPAEERALTTKFGDRYRVYMRRSGRLLPRASRSDSLEPR